MTPDSESQRLRAKQVGMLMRAYRQSFSHRDGGKRLSQDGLLDLMSRVDSSYSRRYDHSTVARWESGAIRPTRERLEVFGLALGLSHAEIDGLVSLAGLDQVTGENSTAELSSEQVNTGETPSTDDVERILPNGGAPGTGGDDSSSYPRQGVRFAVSRFLLPGTMVSIAGYFLALLSWNSSFVFAIFVGVAIILLTAQGLVRFLRSDDLGDLLFVTVFFQLSIPLLHAPLTRMDAYGIYSLGSFAGTSIPFTLSLITNLLVAMIAGLMFRFIDRWQHSGPKEEGNTFSRAAWTVLPPIALVYAFLLAFSSVGFWIVGFVLFTPVAGVLTTLVVLREKGSTIGDWDRKFMLCTATSVVIVLSALGLAGIVVTYLQPSSYDVSEQGLFFSWATDFDALGYPQQEYSERARLAVAWTSLSMLTYMTLVIGGRLIGTIYALGGGSSPSPSHVSTAAASTESSSPLQKRRRSRFDFRPRLAWLSGLLRITRLGRST